MILSTYKPHEADFVRLALVKRSPSCRRPPGQRKVVDLTESNILVVLEG
jgi:hypothetical protein